MLTYIVQRITAAVLSDIEDEQQRALCKYGCELWLYTVLSTLGLLMLGTALGFMIETATMITVFYFCQSNGGGYHASTHMRCFLTMVIGLLFGLLFIQIPVSLLYFFIILCVSAIVLLVFPLCLHPNKRYLSEEADKLKNHSRLITTCVLFSIIVLGIFEHGYVTRSGCVALLLSSVSRLCVAHNKLSL